MSVCLCVDERDSTTKLPSAPLEAAVQVKSARRRLHGPAAYLWGKFRFHAFEEFITGHLLCG